MTNSSMQFRNPQKAQKHLSTTQNTFSTAHLYIKHCIRTPIESSLTTLICKDLLTRFEC